MSWLIVSIAFWLAAAVTFASAWFRRWTTEIDVTDRRVVYKRGFINRHTVEMNMDKVESVDVDQSIMGRMLNLRRHHGARHRRDHGAHARHRRSARFPQSGNGALIR